MLGKEPRLASWARTFTRRESRPSESPVIEQAVTYESRGQIESALDIWRAQEDSPSRAEAIRRLELRQAVTDSNAGRWMAATRRLVQLWKAEPDSEIRRELELAADCGGREAQTEHQWDEACAMWFVCRALYLQDEQKSQLETVNRNLLQCALKGARTAETEEQWELAMQMWEYLRAVDPDSDAAAKGIDRAAHQFVSEIGASVPVPGSPFGVRDPFGVLQPIWQVDVLTRLGCAQEAARRLSELEAQGGKNALTCYQRAVICLHLGQFVEADAAARDSIAISDPVKSRRHISDCLRLATEALCAQDLHAEARKLLMHHLRGREAMSDRDIQALFSTARTRADIEDIRTFLAASFAPNNKMRLNALKHYSIALRDLGYTDEAVAVARDRLLEGLTRRKFGQLPRGRQSGGWASVARRALLDLKTDLDSGGFEFFLTGGTLLGAIRENDILKHDKDIDVGLMPGASVSAVQRHLECTGRFRIKPVPVDHLLRVIHCNGTTIDLFWHWMEDGRFVHQGQKTKWWNTPFTLVSRSFLGTTFKVPSDPELCLSENYANWHEPAPDFDTFVDTPNMIVADRGHLTWYFYTKLFEYFVWGESVQFRKVWQALQDLTMVDADVVAKVSKAMEAAGRANTGEFVGP
jgi:hypothetical protein